MIDDAPGLGFLRGDEVAAAYGDTAGDREMIRMADEKGYRIFKGRSA